MDNPYYMNIILSHYCTKMNPNLKETIYFCLCIIYASQPLIMRRPLSVIQIKIKRTEYAMFYWKNYELKQDMSHAV